VQVVELMLTPRLQPVVLGLLYHCSMEDKYKSMFTYTDAVDKVYDMLMRVQELRNTPELIALAVNLTQNPRNAEVGRSMWHLHLVSLVECSDAVFICCPETRNAGGSVIVGWLEGSFLSYSLVQQTTRMIDIPRGFPVRMWWE
jgi:hypothetical protein